MQQLSTLLALEDFLPVILSAIGLIIITRMIRFMNPLCTRMAFLGVALVTVGGLSKATWKLIFALSEGQTNFVVLDDALFFFLAPGFILLFFSLWYAQQSYYRNHETKNVWLLPVSLAIVAVVIGLAMRQFAVNPEREGRQIWFFILLGITTIFNFATLGLAIWQSNREMIPFAIILFAVNLGAILVLQGLARIETQSEAIQWVEQIINTVAQLGLVYAASSLYRVTTAKIDASKIGSPSSVTA